MLTLMFSEDMVDISMKSLLIGWKSFTDAYAYAYAYASKSSLDTITT